MKQKTIVGVGAALWLAAYFVTNKPITGSLALISSVAVVAFAVPAYRSVINSNGRKRGLIILGVLGVFALLLESIAIKTGFPYGSFEYGNSLGVKVFGLTPWTVAFAYPPIIMLTYYLAKIRHSNRLKICLSTAFDAVLIDLVLDPGAVGLGFWRWDGGGPYYGVPLINFVGWLLTAFLAALLLDLLWGKKPKVQPGLAYGGVMIVWFWTSVNLWLGQLIPAFIGLGISLFLANKLFSTSEKKQEKKH